MWHRLGTGTQKTGKLKKKKRKRRPILFPCLFRLHITFFLIRPRGNTSSLDTNITEFLSIASNPKCFHAILIKGLRDDCPNLKSHILGLFVLFSADISRYHFEERSDELFFLKWQRSNSLISN